MPLKKLMGKGRLFLNRARHRRKNINVYGLLLNRAENGGENFATGRRMANTTGRMRPFHLSKIREGTLPTFLRLKKILPNAKGSRRILNTWLIMTRSPISLTAADSGKSWRTGLH